jgi:peptide/nickel transport system substrate-binding protein
MMIQKRKLLSLVVCLMVIGLMASLISGCAPSNGDGGDGDGDGTVQPQYGGELTLFSAADPTYFDDAIGAHYSTTGPYQCLWGGDWAKGIAGGYGTNDCDWFVRGEVNRLEYKTGKIAESWEIGDDYIEFYLRDGVKWQDKYPCNGREVTADDVVFSWERQRTLDTAYIKTSYPYLASSISVSKVDEDTVRIDCPSEYMAELITLIEFVYIYPQDAIELYGDMNDWENVIGTGAFTLEQYVPGSYLYYERNPLYWQTNPVGPGQGDQLPYLDSVRVLIQPDMSTVDALFTTGQLDLTTADYDRAEQLKTLSDVEYNRFLDGAIKGVIYMRTDKEDKPYSDVRVRQALQLAIDNQKIVDQYFGGEAEVLYWPVYECKEYAGAYVPLEDLDDDMIEVLPDTSISVADLFGYNPELAQELLAEAGYPDGFQAEIVYYNLYIYDDVISMVQSMWAEIGVDLELTPVDYSASITTQYLRNYDDMLWGTFAGVGTYFKGINWQGTGMFNASYVNDPVLNDYRDQMLAAYPNENAVDQIHAEMLPYLLEQCYVVQTAAHYTYAFWWPWLKNYSGEGAVGYYGGASSWTPYVWIDQDLKEDMGYGD